MGRHPFFFATSARNGFQELQSLTAILRFPNLKYNG